MFGFGFGFSYSDWHKLNNPPPVKPADVTRKLTNSAGYKARKEYWKR